LSSPPEGVITAVVIFLDCLGFDMDDESYRLLPRTSASGWNNAKHYLANWMEL
jgi:hypothetical protein